MQRHQILQDIKAEFRDNRALTDPRRVAEAHQVALRSLEQLQAYSGMDTQSTDWQVSLKGACE